MREFIDEGFLLEVEIGVDLPGDCENADAWLTVVEDGTRWSITFLSHAEVGRILERWTVSGECLGGRYFVCPDAVLLRKGGVGEMVAAARDLFASGEYRVVLREIGVE